MEQEGSESARAHILAIPYPLMGHMTPMIQLCRVLMSKGRCMVTMVSPERAMGGLRKLLPAKEELQCDDGIRVVSVSDGLPLNVMPTDDWDVWRKVLRARNDPRNGMPRSFEALMSTFTDVTCVISDVHLPWTHDVASRLGVPHIALWVSATAEFHVYNIAQDLIDSGKLPFKAPKGQGNKDNGICNMMPQRRGKPPVYRRVEGENEESIEVEGLPHLARRDFPTFLQIEDPSDSFFHEFIGVTQWCRQASLVVANSFQALEGGTMELLRSRGIPMHPIGPLFLLEAMVLMKQSSRIEDVDIEQGSPKDIKHNACLQWLDTQEPRSVMYVAFGTIVHLTKAQVNELALGLEASEQPFIWVLPEDKDELGGEKLPQHFLESIQGKGMVLKWAPQKEILQHPSIGAFLSHCGWNSVLEATCSGVPMIGLPFVSDQTLHCKMMVEVWKVALRLERNLADGIALAGDISRLTQEILLTDKGKELRKRAQGLMIAAKKSVQVGGSSRMTMDAIFNIIN